MALFDTISMGATDKPFEQRYNKLVLLLNRWTSTAITKSEVLHAEAHKAAAQTFASSTTATKIAFDTITGDATLSSNGILIPSGTWIAIISMYVEFAANTTGVRFFRIMNGTNGIAFQKANAATTGTTLQQLCVNVNVSGGDVIYGYAYQNSGGNLDLTGTIAGSTLRVTLIPIT